MSETPPLAGSSRGIRQTNQRAMARGAVIRILTLMRVAGGGGGIHGRLAGLCRIEKSGRWRGQPLRLRQIRAELCSIRLPALARSPPPDRTRNSRVSAKHVGSLTMKPVPPRLARARRALGACRESSFQGASWPLQVRRSRMSVSRWASPGTLLTTAAPSGQARFERLAAVHARGQAPDGAPAKPPHALAPCPPDRTIAAWTDG